MLWRVKKNTRLPVIAPLPDGSWITRITDPAAVAARARASGQRRRRGTPQPPAAGPLPAIIARVVSFTITVTADDGTTRTEPYLLITSLLDCRACPARQLAALYARRWAIETGYRECKTYLRGPGRILRGRSPVLARQELWALLAVYQAIRILITRAAARDSLDPGQISFTTTLNALTRDMTTRHDHRPALDTLDNEILAPAALIPPRPGRICIRAVKKPSSPYKSRHNTTSPLPQHATYTTTITPPPHPTTPANQAKQPARHPANPP